MISGGVNVFSAVVIGLVTTTVPVSAQIGKFDPKREYVPDAPTAIAIGRAISIPIYGEKQVESEEPLTATRKGDIWFVLGTAHCPQSSPTPAWVMVCGGGALQVTLSAKDGHVLGVAHLE